MDGSATTPAATSAPPARDRRTFLGASDIAAVLGLNPYKTPRDVWAEKTAQEPAPVLDNDDVARGLAMEPVLDTMIRRRGIQLIEGGEFEISGSCVVVHPDRLSPDGVWELKAPRRWTKQWGEEGTDQVPELYLVQIMVQMMAVQLAGRSVERSHIAAMCGELRTYPIQYVEASAEKIVTYADKWWHRHVVGGAEPPAHSLVELQQIVKRRPAWSVPSDLVARVRRIKMARKIKSAVEDIEREEKRFVLAALEKDGTLPESIESGGEPVAEIRRGGRRQFDEEAFRRADPETHARYLKRIEWNEIRPHKNLSMVPMNDLVLIEADDE